MSDLIFSIYYSPEVFPCPEAVSLLCLYGGVGSNQTQWTQRQDISEIVLEDFTLLQLLFYL